MQPKTSIRVYDKISIHALLAESDFNAQEKADTTL